jgi:hypothetical protein
MDIIKFGSDQQRRPPPRRRVVIGVGVLLTAALGALAVLAVADNHDRPLRAPSVAPPSSDAPATADPKCEAPKPETRDVVAGLVIDNGDGQRKGILERYDRTAVDGPWTVVVRRTYGSLARYGAVVTFPVQALATGRAVRVGRVIGRAGDDMVVWPLAGGYARVRGDVDEATLVEIAAHTTVTSGQPTLLPFAGYAVVSAGHYRPTLIREARYGSAALGEQASLGAGLTYTAIADGGGIEDQLYAAHARDAGLVRGVPAVVSSVLGGNAALVWEPTPGVTAYVGYSGAELDDDAMAALRRLAERGCVLTAAEWRATGSQTISQINEIG